MKELLLRERKGVRTLLFWTILETPIMIVYKVIVKFSWNTRSYNLIMIKFLKYVHVSNKRNSASVGKPSQLDTNWSASWYG